MNLPQDLLSQKRVVRWIFIVLGWLMVVLGVVGIVVPGLPTTIFLIIAIWAFSRGSLRFQQWLWHHPRLGLPLQNWYTHRVIPLKAKMLAVATMAMSIAVVAYGLDDGLMSAFLLAVVLLPVAIYICTRDSVPPETL